MTRTEVNCAAPKSPDPEIIHRVIWDPSWDCDKGGFHALKWETVCGLEGLWNPKVHLDTDDQGEITCEVGCRPPADLNPLARADVLEALEAATESVLPVARHVNCRCMPR